MKKVTKTKVKAKAAKAKTRAKRVAKSQVDDFTTQAQAVAQDVSAKAQDLTAQAKEFTGKAVDQVVDYAATLDYKTVAKNALKVAIPLVVMKMVHSKYQQATSKKSSWEKTIAPLFEEIKSKLKDM